ncbi:hypothetical protein Tco_0850896 [Tanacetum coccineum]
MNGSFSIDEGLYLMRRSLEVLRKFHWMILGGRFNQLSHVSSPLLSKPGEYPGNGVTSSTHAVIKPTFMMASQPFHDGVSSIRLARRSSKITHDGFFD